MFLVFLAACCRGALLSGPSGSGGDSHRPRNEETAYTRGQNNDELRMQHQVMIEGQQRVADASQFDNLVNMHTAQIAVISSPSSYAR